MCALHDKLREACHESTVLALQAFREDRTLICAMDYIAEALGPRFVESVPLNMERAWAESHPRCPLICLLSPGAQLCQQRISSSNLMCNPEHCSACRLQDCFWRMKIAAIQ